MIILNKYPVITLKSGIRVVNFSSPHKYVFNSGEVLSACEAHVAEAAMLGTNHTGIAHLILQDNTTKDIAVPILDTWSEYIDEEYPELDINTRWLNVFMDYKMSDIVRDDIRVLAELDNVDIILVPYPVLEEWKKQAELVFDVGTVINEGVLVDDPWEKGLKKMRTCHFYDRVTKTIHHDRFCK